MKSKPTPRALRMWANYYPEATICWPTKRRALIRSGPSRRHRAIPVAVIPLNDQGALIAKATDAFLAEIRQAGRYITADCMVAALTAIGVLPRQRKGGAK